MAERLLLVWITIVWTIFHHSEVRSLGCNLFMMCVHQRVTCRQKPVDGDWSETVGPEICDNTTLLEQTVIFTAADGRGLKTLANSSLDGLLTQTLVIRMKIASIEAGAFQGLRSGLNVLDISGNHLSRLPGGVFSGLSTVMQLNLGLNKFAKIPIEPLQNLIRLKELIMVRNELRGVSREDLAGLHQLTYLDLSYNGIRHVDAASFVSLSHLQVLNIHGNQFICDCRLAWLRYFKKCLCAFDFDNCSEPPVMTQYTVAGFPLNHLNCSSDGVQGQDGGCNQTDCDYVGEYPEPREPYAYFLDTPLESPSDPVTTRHFEKDTIENTVLGNTQASVAFSGGNQSLREVTHTGVMSDSGLGENKSESSSNHAVFNVSLGATLWTSCITVTEGNATENPRHLEVKKLPNGWKVVSVIGGLAVLTLVSLGGVRFYRTMGGRQHNRRNGRVSLPKDMGQVMYASSVGVDTEERTMISDVTDVQDSV